jgi:hypothetical protein
MQHIREHQLVDGQTRWRVVSGVIGEAKITKNRRDRNTW